MVYEASQGGSWQSEFSELSKTLLSAPDEVPRGFLGKSYATLFSLLQGPHYATLRD